tara:strand:- start:1498 stop:1650 length:153 start_codon:yes stop_codon:yes gene_type:complete
MYYYHGLEHESRMKSFSCCIESLAINPRVLQDHTKYTMGLEASGLGLDNN